MNSDSLPASSKSPFSRWLVGILLAVLFGLGIFLRVYDLSDLPLDFHPTRQMHSAVIARALYYETLQEAPAEQRATALEQARAEGIIEPPILERLTAWAYPALGGEQLWFPRLLSGLFWLAGALGVYRIACRIAGAFAGLASLAYVLCLPFAVLASRSFQPDPLMTALIVWTLWAILRWQQRPTPPRALLAGLLGGLAILVKSVAVFFIAGAWLGVLLAGPGLRAALRQKPLWVALLLTILPYALYHIYGYYIAGYLRDQFALRFFPNLWIDPLFYLRWVRKLQASAGLVWLLLAVVSLWSVPSRAHRGLLLGYLGGYLAYCLTFSYHISTHDYYQLPLIPLVALGLGSAAGSLLGSLRAAGRWAGALAAAALLAGVLMTAYDVRATLKNTDYRPIAAEMAALGAELRGYALVGVFPDYGYRLKYWGWVTPEIWFAPGDFEYRALAGQTIDPRDLFAEKTTGKDFFVVADLESYAAQPVLQQILSENYPVWKQTPNLLIYDLRSPK